MMYPLNLKTDARFRLAIALTGLVASQGVAESPDGQYGLANLLGNTPAIAETIRPTPADPISAEELNTPSRRHAPSYRQEAQAGNVPVEVVINWREIRERAMASVAAQAPKEDAAPAKEKPERLRPQSARERLLFALTPAIPESKAKERVAPSVSDLGAFRARALASDAFAPPPLIAPHDYPRHNAGNGRHAPKDHVQGYAQPE